MLCPPLGDVEARGHVLESKLGVDRTNFGSSPMPPRGRRKVNDIRAPRLSGVHNGQGQGHHEAKPLSKLPKPGGMGRGCPCDPWQGLCTGVHQSAQVTQDTVKIAFIRSSRIGWSQGNNPRAACKPAGQTNSYLCITGEGADGDAGWQITQDSHLGRGLSSRAAGERAGGAGFPRCALVLHSVLAFLCGMHHGGLTCFLPCEAGESPGQAGPRQSRTVCPYFQSVPPPHTAL